MAVEVAALFDTPATVKTPAEAVIEPTAWYVWLRHRGGVGGGKDAFLAKWAWAKGLARQTKASSDLYEPSFWYHEVASVTRVMDCPEASTTVASGCAEPMELVYLVREAVDATKGSVAHAHNAHSDAQAPGHFLVCEHTYILDNSLSH